MPKGRFEADEIELLPGVEAIRRRPGLYVGDPTKPAALVQITLEPLCLALDEKTGGPAQSVVISLLDDDIAEIANDGPGLPLGGRPGRSETFIELIMTKLHACRDEKSDDVHRRWCQAGVAVLCALSEWCAVTVQRDGGVWMQRFENGVVASPLERQGDTNASGTSVLFKPDRSILFGSFDRQLIEARLREFVLEVPCVTATFRDLRIAQPV